VAVFFPADGLPGERSSRKHTVLFAVILQQRTDGSATANG
jgi:hypothetical protein